MPSYDDLTVLFINCTLNRSPEVSHTQGLAARSIALLEEQGATVESLRLVDFEVAPGVQPDMREHGWDADAWPDVVWPKVVDADILIIGTAIQLGEPTSEARKLIERLYAMSDETNDAGQPIFYGKVAGVITTGNEDGVKNSGRNLLWALQHIGYTIPPAAETGGSATSARARRTSTRVPAGPRTSSRPRLSRRCRGIFCTSRGC